MAVSYGTYTITEVQEGSQIWTTTVAPVSPNYTFTISNLTGDSETSIKVGDIIMYSYYRYTVLSISDDGTTVLTGNRVSIRGATGAASVTYTLIVSSLAIIKDKNGNISPTTITLTAKSQTGSSAMANYAGRFKIETTTNNSTWTIQYTSSANEATKNWTVIDDIIAVRCSLYLKDGTTTLLDQQTIPIVSDGIDGTSISISSTSVTYQKGTSGTTKPTGTWETTIPSVGQGEYLWTKTVVTYSDSSKTESYSVSRNAVNGTNGTNGTNGKDGTSPTVTSTVTEYVQSDSGTTTPISGWNTTPPTATAGKYMWTKVTVTYSDNATAVSYTVSKNGTNGNNGINTATVYLYKKGTTAPSVPSGNTTYTFSTKKLTGTLDSWSQTIPTTGDGECYVTAAVASSSGTTDTIGTGEWSTPIQFNGTNGTNGTDGTNGLNQATIFLYKRGASVTKPTTSVTYTFSSGALSAEPDSWKRNIPTIDGNPCWVVTATAIGSGATATITGSNWSDPVKLVEDGEDGKDAYTVILTNENHTFTGNTTSALASEIECNVIAYKGTTQVASTIGAITGQPTGMTTSLLNNGTVNAAFKVTVTTSMVTRNGILNVPITVDGKTFTKKFTYSLALKGTSGTSENLLMDVYTPSLNSTDTTWSKYLSDATNSTITGQFIAESNLPDPNATHFYRITDSSATTKGRGLCFYGSSGTPPFITGHTYRIGCWVRKHSGSPKVQITIGSIGSWMHAQRKIENTEWEWVEVVRTFGETDASKTTQSNTYKKLYFYFYNGNVAGSSLDMCGFRMEEIQTNSGTARNLLLGTEKLTNWGVVNGATISDGVATFPTITSNSWREIYPAKNFKYDLIRNQYAIFSIKVKGNVDEKCCINLCVGVDTTETAYTRQKYFNQMIFFIGTGEWQTVCSAVPIFDYMFSSGSGTVDFNNCWVTVRIGAVNTYWNGFEAKEPQLSLGTTATSWTPAPEDIIVGKNLIPLSKNLKLFTPENLTRSTVTYTDDSCTITNTYGDVRYGVYYDIDVESGLTYTLSFQASNVSGTNINYGVGNRTPDQTASWNTITGGYKNVVNGSNVCSFTIPDTVTKVRIYFGVGSLNGTMTIGDLKLEVGNRATEWTSAPEDIQYAMKVANNYLSMDSTGIMVADMNDGEQTPSEATGNNVFIDNTSVNIRDGQTTLASFGVDGMQIGLSNESHTTQDYHSWQMVDKDGNIYAYISDLRDKTGTATITEINASLEYQYGGEYYFTPAYPADSVISITINNNQVSSFEIKSAGKYIKTVPSPTTSDNTIITYTSSSSLLKAYTLGNRKENSVTGAFSFVEGYNNVGSGRYSHVEGFDNESSAIGSHSEGHGNIASGNNSHVEGGGNVASDSCAHAEGLDCVASGFVSHAEGSNTTASGSYAHSEGFNSTAKGTASHAEGYSTANEDGSHAEGSSTANAWYSHAEGSGTANGVRSHAEGTGTANGELSHAEGTGTANGELSHAEGTGTANGVLAHAQNQGTKASSRAQTAIGKYNIEDTADTYAFIIGNGTYDSSRSNALTVKWDGTITAANGFSTANTALTITRSISTTYMTDTQFNRLKAYKKNGMLFLLFNAEFTSAGLSASSKFVAIGKISGWNAISPVIVTVPCQMDASKAATINVTADGSVEIYSKTLITSWFRTFVCVPCSS